MRTTIAIIFTMALLACKKGENAGAEEARAQAEKEQKTKEATGGVAKKINPPVPGRAKLSCANVIDADKFTQLLGETVPLKVKDSITEADAAASCSIIRGGKRLNEAEQKAALKTKGRLGVLPGDELCNISTFCWTIEDPDRFLKKCTESKDNKIDSGLGFQACLRVIATGEDDVNNWRFFDEDTKCIIGVRAGPSNVDNAMIGNCAKGAHDLIGPDQIKPGAAPRAPAAGSGT